MRPPSTVKPEWVPLLVLLHSWGPLPWTWNLPESSDHLQLSSASLNTQQMRNSSKIN